MKKIAIIVLILLTVVFINNAHAYNLMDKLARGLFNIIISPLEFFQAYSDDMEERDPALGVAHGVVRGTINAAKRAGVGLFEVITFWIPIPDYGPILDEPVFLAEKRFEKEEEERRQADAERERLKAGESIRIE